MLELVERRAADQCDDTLIFVEHPPVVTRGRGLQLRSAPAATTTTAPYLTSQASRSLPLLAPLPQGVEYVEVERGGDLTVHFPGQLVVYPVVKLLDHDLTGFLRRFESATIRALEPVIAPLGLAAFAKEGATGVWVKPNAGTAPARKLASLGIAVRKWVTFHGMALNLQGDLGAFSWISPCGFEPEVMTSLERLGVKDCARKSWEARLSAEYSSLMVNKKNQ